MRICPHPACKKEMTYSTEASSLLRDVFYCFNDKIHAPIRVEKKSGFSWCLTGAKVVTIFALTGIPDVTDLPEVIQAVKDFCA
jgi:hypothetical protein